METTNILDNTSQSNEQAFSSQAIQFLTETARWAKFLSILGFILIGFMVIGALSIGTLMNAISDASQLSALGFPSVMFTIIYLIVAGIYFFPVYYLFMFSSKMLQSARNKDTAELTNALSNLKSHYKFLGIFTIIILSFYVLMILFVVLAAAFS